MPQQFPLFWLPVGDTKNEQAQQATRCGISDNGTGINLGDLDYHFLSSKTAPSPSCADRNYFISAVHKTLQHIMIW